MEIVSIRRHTHRFVALKEDLLLVFLAALLQCHVQLVDFLLQQLDLAFNRDEYCSISLDIARFSPYRLAA